MVPVKNKVQKTNFETKKKQLKLFSERLPEVPEFEKFKTHGFIFSHKVTGDEMNDFVAKLQDCLIDFNEHNRKLVKEFGQVYETFEALDKEYINGILIGVESAKTASQEAKKAQKKITKTINELQETVQTLENMGDDVFQLEKVTQSISDEVQEISANMRKCADTLDGFEKKVNPILAVLQADVEKLLLFREEANRCAHFADIDVMWKRMEEYEAQMEVNINNEMQLRRQIKFAGVAAGSALLLAAGHIIMLLTGNV